MKKVIKLDHTHNIEESNTRIETNMSVEELDQVIAYIQFKIDDKVHAYDIGEDEVASVLNKFYNTKDTIESEDAIIDLYVNWEKWCGKKAGKLMDNMDLHKEGLDEYLNSLILV